MSDASVGIFPLKGLVCDLALVKQHAVFFVLCSHQCSTMLLHTISGRVPYKALESLSQPMARSNVPFSHDLHSQTGKSSSTASIVEHEAG